MPTLRAALVIAAGAALLLSGCQSNGETGSAGPTTSGEAAATGALTVIATDAADQPIADVEIELERALDCNLRRRVITPGTSYTHHFTETTDQAGTAQFSDLPLGCYKVSAEDPDGVALKAGSPRAAFLSEDEPVQDLVLEFGESGESSAPECDAEEISEDLDIPEEQRNAEATIVECVENWSIIRWDIPGDSQRAVRYFGRKWLTYVAFPNDRCWKQARHDGAPRSFEKFFQPC